MKQWISEMRGPNTGGGFTLPNQADTIRAWLNLLDTSLSSIELLHVGESYKAVAGRVGQVGWP